MEMGAMSLPPGLLGSVAARSSTGGSVAKI
jgi:hypothetical protein